METKKFEGNKQITTELLNENKVESIRTKLMFVYGKKKYAIGKVRYEVDDVDEVGITLLELVKENSNDFTKGFVEKALKNKKNLSEKQAWYVAKQIHDNIEVYRAAMKEYSQRGAELSSKERLGEKTDTGFKAVKYFHELPIGTRFQFPNQRGVYILTHKLGENGYEGTTYPFRYRDSSIGIELPTQNDYEVIPLPKKGDSYSIESFIPGRIVTSTCIGYVVGIEYNSEGNLIEWLLNKDGDLTKLQESPKIFATPEQAEKFIKKVKPRYTQYIYYRPYIHIGHKDTLSD